MNSSFRPAPRYRPHRNNPAFPFQDGFSLLLYNEAEVQLRLVFSGHCKRTFLIHRRSQQNNVIARVFLPMTAAIDETVNEIRGCALCASHLPFAPRPILQLHPNSKILIAGQAPGRKVHETGIPFNDASGRRLRTWLGVDEALFYNPEKIAILPMGFCYPGQGIAGDLPPRSECAEQWRLRLLKHLPNIRLILLIGHYAQQWHLKDTKKASLTETVKAWREYWPTVLPMPHPSPRNNRWLKRNPWFEAEVIPILRGKLADILDNREKS